VSLQYQNIVSKSTFVVDLDAAIQHFSVYLNIFVLIWIVLVTLDVIFSNTFNILINQCWSVLSMGAQLIELIGEIMTLDTGKSLTLLRSNCFLTQCVGLDDFLWNHSKWVADYC